MDALDDLPALHARWARELLTGPVPVETEATCAACPMVDANRDTGFDATTKCCTFLPELHNFLVGAVLADDDPAAADGAATVRARIARRVAVTPLGLGRTQAYMLVYDEGGPVTFGRKAELRCPHHLADGRCGVWRHRESTCATWFCKHVRGDVGRDFWQSLRGTFVLVERALAWSCLDELGFDRERLAPLIGRTQRKRSEADEFANSLPARYAALWGNWVGREDELYRACAERVAGLSWRDALALAGAEAAVAAKLARDKHAALLSTTLPARVVVAPFRILALTGDSCQIAAYSDYDPIELSRVVLDVLPRFDGRPVDAVLADLAGDDIEVDPTLIRTLIDYGVLVTA